MATKIIPIGTKFGRLEVIGKGEPRQTKEGWNLGTSLVRCECGTEKTIANSKLKNGNTKSCKCLNRELSTGRAQLRTTHKMSMSHEYSVWSSMKQRCSNEACDGYSSYGGRGITVCWRWFDSFENFIEDMGPRPSASHSIDRVDNNAGYSKENCRWASRSEQGCNTRSNRKFTFYSKTLTITEWSRITQVPRASIFNRLRRGWPEKEAFWKQSRCSDCKIRRGLSAASGRR